MIPADEIEQMAVEVSLGKPKDQSRYAFNSDEHEQAYDRMVAWKQYQESQGYGGDIAHEVAAPLQNAGFE